MTKYIKFLWTAYQAYQGDPQAARETLTTIAGKLRESDPTRP